jgi:hypothetical protein
LTLLERRVYRAIRLEVIALLLVHRNQQVLRRGEWGGRGEENEEREGREETISKAHRRKTC